MKGRGTYQVTSLFFILFVLSGADLPGGAAHFAAFSAATGLEDPRAGGKSHWSVPTNTCSINCTF